MSKFPAIGELKERVRIQSLTRNPDGGGGVSETWSDVVDVWAKIEPISSREIFYSHQIALEATHKITIRYRADVSTDWRILRVRDGAVFKIAGFLDVENAHRYLELQVNEETAADG
jgi:SPP1 family predicted phage head-tail adaptor